MGRKPNKKSRQKNAKMADPESEDTDLAVEYCELKGIEGLSHQHMVVMCRFLTIFERVEEENSEVADAMEVTRLCKESPMFSGPGIQFNIVKVDENSADTIAKDEFLHLFLITWGRAHYSIAFHNEDKVFLTELLKVMQEDGYDINDTKEFIEKNENLKVDEDGKMNVGYFLTEFFYPVFSKVMDEKDLFSQACDVERRCCEHSEDESHHQHGHECCESTGLESEKRQQCCGNAEQNDEQKMTCCEHSGQKCSNNTEQNEEQCYNELPPTVQEEPCCKHGEHVDHQCPELNEQTDDQVGENDEIVDHKYKYTVSSKSV